MVIESSFVIRSNEIDHPVYAFLNVCVLYVVGVFFLCGVESDDIGVASLVDDPFVALEAAYAYEFGMGAARVHLLEPHVAAVGEVEDLFDGLRGGYGVRGGECGVHGGRHVKVE